MPSDGFASRTTTTSGGARATLVGFAVVVAMVAFLATSPGGHPAAPSPSPSTAVLPASPSAAPAAPSPSAAPIGVEWAVIPDGSGLAGLGGPVAAAAGPQGIVAIGSRGLAWSADGATWIPVERGPIGVPVVATAGGFFALGDGLGWSSADGRTWANVDAPEARGFVIRGIVAVGAELIAIGALRDPGAGATWDAVFSTTDGWTWGREQVTFPPFDMIAASGDTVVAAAPVPDGGRQVSVRRSDGTWTDLSWFGADANFASLASRPEGGFVAVGSVGTDGPRRVGVWSSVDGLRWDQHVSTGLEGVEPAGIVATDDGFLLLGTTETGGLWRSEDGVAWTAVPYVRSFDTGRPTTVVVAPGRLVALGGSPSADDPVMAWTSPPVAPEPTVPTPPTSGTWANAGPLPAAIDGDRLVALGDGSLLLLGGPVPDATMGVRYTTDVWRRDARGTWTRRAPMSGAWSTVVSTVAGDGRVWLVGTSYLEGAEATSGRVQVYDPATDRWSSGPALPADVTTWDAVTLADRSVLLITSGIEVWRFRPGERSGTRVARVPWGGWPVAAAVLPDGSLVLVGAQIVSEPSPTSPGGMREQLRLQALRMDPATGAAEPLRAPTSGAPSTGTLVRLGDGRVALVGQARLQYGAGGGLVLRRVDVYDPVLDRWEQLTSLPEPRVGAGVAVDPEGRLWVGGGTDLVADVAPFMATDTLFVWTPATRPFHGR